MADTFEPGEAEREIRLSQMMDYVIGNKKEILEPLSKFKSPTLFYTPIEAIDPNVRKLNKLQESCLVRSAISCVMGGVLGIGFGLFTASIDPSLTGLETPTVKNTLREMRTRMLQMSKNFAFIGAIFSGTECCVDTVRGRSELLNGTMAGGITGFMIGFRAGFVPALWSAGGFMVFSTVVDYYFRY